MNGLFMDECATFGWTCHFWMNVLQISKTLLFLFEKPWLTAPCLQIPWIYCLFLSYQTHFTLSEINIKHVSNQPIAWWFWYHLYNGAMCETSISCQGSSFRRNLTGYLTLNSILWIGSDRFKYVSKILFESSFGMLR